MKIEKLDGGWVKQGSVIAFPYDWQKPVKTEEWIYDELIKNEVNSIFVEFVSFPWATLVDSLERKKVEKIEILTNALKKIPIKKSLIRATACQHINISTILNLLISVGITDLFWSHKENHTHESRGIRLHLLPLYPISYFNDEVKLIKPLVDRKYLYSFLGAVDLPSYISDIRKKILNYRNMPNSKIISRDEWHFEKYVYEYGLNGVTPPVHHIKKLNKKMDIYTSILGNTVYSLCPSGSGPNTIRHWESLAYGCIPVILSDTFDDAGIFGPTLKIKEIKFDEFIISISNNFECVNLNEEMKNQTQPQYWLEKMVFWIFKDKNKVIKMIKGERDEL